MSKKNMRYLDMSVIVVSTFLAVKATDIKQTIVFGVLAVLATVALVVLEDNNERSK